MHWRRRRGGSTLRGDAAADICPRVAYVAAMTATSRKTFGVLAIVAGLIAYAGLVSRLLAPVGQLPWYASAPLYLVLGCLWLLPLKPLLQWMTTGTWRAPK
jgi:predicted membrane channel-forming protein YqfA (hemolysin III family)